MKNLWKKLKHWCCKVGLCNLDKCSCDCHDKPRGRSKAYFTTIKESRAKKIETKKATPFRFSRKLRDQAPKD